jgi:heme oxygenase
LHRSLDIIVRDPSPNLKIIKLLWVLRITIIIQPINQMVHNRLLILEADQYLVYVLWSFLRYSSFSSIAPTNTFLKVIQPARNKPTENEFFTYDSTGEKKPNHEFLKAHFYREGRLTEEQALYILEQATKIFSTEANMVPVKSPVTSA